MFQQALLIFVSAILSLPLLRAIPVEPYETDLPLGMVSAPSAALDNLVKQNSGGIRRARLCSDEVFLRRVFLDTIGTLPTMEEVRSFLADKSTDKRSKLVDQLLERPEYADYWGMRWADLLRVKSEFPVNLWPNAAQAYDRWIRTSLRDNLPYSEFARHLLTAEGSNFRSPPVNFLRSAGDKDPAALGSIAALVFLGERTAGWTPEKRDAFAKFFSRVGFKKSGEWKEEIVFFARPSDNEPLDATLPDGSKVKIPAKDDPREVLAQWLLNSPKSTFAQNGANRIWFWIFGRGIVQEPDDFRPDNPPSNPALLAWLGRQFQASKYDTKQLLRTILNSETYQLSSIPRDDHPADAGYTSYPVRRLEAEVLIDAINQITGGREEYMSRIPEPFTYLPEDQRAVMVPDGSISSSLLELFGRPPRDTGLLSERTTNVTASQRLSLLNSKSILSKINKSGQIRRALSTAPNQEEALNRLYLTFLSRFPTADEMKTISDYQPPTSAGKNQKLMDIAWVLVNSPEFLYRH